jgi:hypothetical protein
LEQSTLAARATAGLSPTPNVTKKAKPTIPGTIFLTSATLLKVLAYGIKWLLRIAETMS